MIRPIDIRLNAAHPELPLQEAVTFTGSPSAVLIRGVPPNCGRWAITAVFVAAAFPDGSTTTRAAVQSANGVWVATIPATEASGRTANGIRIMADGVGENGEAVAGYILGVADFAVASLDVTPAPEPGETSYQMLYFDLVPSVVHKGDVTKIDGVLKFYNGSAWELFAESVSLDDTVTHTSANGVKSSGIWAAIWGALTALPTGISSLYDWCAAQLEGKLDKSGGKMTGALDMDGSVVKWRDGNLIYWLSINGLYIWTDGGDSSHSPEWIITFPRNNGVLSLLEDIAPDYEEYASTTYSAADLRVHENTLYRCTTAHTATTWQGANWTTATVEDVLAALRTALAHKADKPATFTDGDLAKFDSAGNPVDSQIPAANVAVKGGLPYALGSTTTISAASTDPQTSATYGEAAAVNREGARVVITTAIDELRLTLPAAVSGKLRDFIVRVDVGTGSAAMAAPSLVKVNPAGETITIETDDGTIPALADGTATAKGVTLLSFTEDCVAGKFYVTAKEVKEVV